MGKRGRRKKAQPQLSGKYKGVELTAQQSKRPKLPPFTAYITLKDSGEKKDDEDGAEDGSCPGED